MIFWVIKYWSIKKNITRMFEWLTRTKRSFRRESWLKMINLNSSRSRSCLSFQDNCLLFPSSLFKLGFLKPSNRHWPNRLGRVVLAEFFDKIGLSYVFDGLWWGVLSLFNRVSPPPSSVRRIETFVMNFGMLVFQILSSAKGVLQCSLGTKPGYIWRLRTNFINVGPSREGESPLQ